MPREQMVMGALVALLCLYGLSRDRWLLETTRKGQRLVSWLGRTRALWTLRGLLVLGVAFGALLALDVVRPIRWP